MITKTTASIYFSYLTSDLLDKVKQHAGMVAKTLPDSEAAVITSDETEWFNREMTKAFTFAYNLCHKLSTGLITGCVWNVGTPAVYGFYVKNLGGHYDHSLNIIDTNIENFVVEKVLSQWWLKCALPDPYKVSVAASAELAITLNNSLYSLYKPTISLVANYQLEDAIIDTDTETETTTTVTIPTTTPNEVLYFDHYADFPTVGEANKIYIDKEFALMYLWNGTAYVQYFYVAPAIVRDYLEVPFYEVSELTVDHGMDILFPIAHMIDTDGYDCDFDTEPISTSQTKYQWNGLKSGILYLSK